MLEPPRLSGAALQLPNMRLKLPGGDRSKGSGVFAPWRAQTFVHGQLRRRARRPQLKRDPLDSGGGPLTLHGLT